jgi:hypothetical protein
VVIEKGDPLIECAVEDEVSHHLVVLADAKAPSCTSSGKDEKSPFAGNVLAANLEIVSP